MLYFLKMFLPHNKIYIKKELKKEELINEINCVMKNKFGLGIIKFNEKEFENKLNKKKCENIFWNMKEIEITHENPDICDFVRM